MSRLKDMDSAMYERLTQRRSMDICYTPDLLSEDIITGLFSVNDGLCKWGDTGIIARLVEGVFMMDGTQGQVFRIIRRNNAVSILRTGFEQTIHWMVQHDFPAELVKWNEDRMQAYTS